jgi:hypothetical protein
LGINFPWLVLGLGFCACYDTPRPLAFSLPESQAQNFEKFGKFEKK